MFSRFEVDYSLYLVTDTELCIGRELIDVVTAAVAGGVSLVQLREKNMSTRAFVELARAVKQSISPYNVPLIINDRLDVMLAVQAEGIHVGQKDMHPNDIRQLMGNACIVGYTVDDIEDIAKADKLDVDYTAFVVFPTQTKKDIASPFGLEAASKARLMTSRKLIAIGGINAENAKSVYETGVDGIAVVSAICSAQDPRLAANKLRKLYPSKLLNASIKNSTIKSKEENSFFADLSLEKTPVQ